LPLPVTSSWTPYGPVYTSGSHPGTQMDLHVTHHSIWFIPTAILGATASPPIMDSTSRLVARHGGLNPPPDVILSWPKANRVNPEERSWAAPIILLILMGITFLVYIARMWARLVLSKNAGLDDVLISLAILPLFGLTISTVLGKTHIIDSRRSLIA
jgi:hypothetical protein